MCWCFFSLPGFPYEFCRFVLSRRLHSMCNNTAEIKFNLHSTLLPDFLTTAFCQFRMAESSHYFHHDLERPQIAQSTLLAAFHFNVERKKNLVIRLISNYCAARGEEKHKNYKNDTIENEMRLINWKRPRRCLFLLLE